MILFQTGSPPYAILTEKLTMATRNSVSSCRLHLTTLTWNRCPIQLMILEARVYESEDELEAARNCIQEERTARQDAERRAAEAEAEVARLRERLRRMGAG